MAVDLSQFDLPADRGMMEVIHPETGEQLTDGEGRGLFIEVLSVDSKEFKRRESLISKRVVRRRGNVSPDEFQTDRTVAATTRFVPEDGFALDGNVLDATKEADVRRLYQRQAWLRDDVNAYMNDRSNYAGN